MAWKLKKSQLLSYKNLTINKKLFTLIAMNFFVKNLQRTYYFGKLKQTYSPDPMARLSLFPLMKNMFSPVQSKTSILSTGEAGGCSSLVGLVGWVPVGDLLSFSSGEGAAGGTKRYRKDSPVP
jgi:hypothetical protein